MKRNIYLMYAIALLQGMVFYAPIATLYRQAAGVGIFQITLIESISMALMIALELPWGRAADRIGYRKTMLICCGLYFVSKLVFWQAQGFGGFLLERVLLSVVCAGLSGVESAVLYLSCPPEHSHRVLSRHYYLQQLGLLLAASVYALYIGADYRLAALLTAVSYGVAALLALGLAEVRPPQKSAARPKLRSLLAGHFADRRLLCLVVAMALLEQAHQAITVFLNQLQYLRAGMGEADIATAYIAVSIVGLCGGASAWLSGKLGMRRGGSLLFALAALCCVVAAQTAQPLLSVLAVLGLRAVYSLLQPLYLELQNRFVTTADRATALSINSLLQQSLGVLLMLAFGYAAEFSVAAAMLLGVLLCGSGLIVYRLGIRT